MNYIKRYSLIFFAVLLLFAFFSVQAFAVDPVSAIGIAGALDAYGMAYGVGTVYDVSSNTGISDSFTGLWDEFSQYQANNNAALPKVNGVSVNYEDYIDEWQSNYKALHGFSHSSGTFAAWSIDAESAEVFDQFWNWLLTGPAEMVKVDNEYYQFSSAQIGSSAVPITVASFATGSWAGQPMNIWRPNNGMDDLWGVTFPLGKNGDYNDYASLSRANTSRPIYVFYTDTIYFVSPYSDAEVNVYQRTTSTNPYTYSASGWTPLGNFDSTTSLYYSIWSAPYQTMYVPHYDSLSGGLAAVSDVISDGVPADTIGVRAYDDTGVVTLPNPYGQDYVPVPLEIVTSVPWDDSYNPEDEENGVPCPWVPDAVPNVVDDIGDSISAEDYAIEADPQPDPDPDPNPGPGEVFLPFIPVSIPSFNFNLSGIWHYVREWVSSLGAWLSMMLTIWAALPYAMVVPVYACIVIVIVLGVYRRFFM